MPATMPDLTFFDSDRCLWDKKILGKIRECISAIKENGGDEANEDCLQIFFLDFEQAQSNFINKIRSLPLIMKCRTKADSESNFGGRQCAEFMKEIERACDKYFNMSIYSNSAKDTSPVYIVKKIKSMAYRSETNAWEFEDRTRQEYLNTGKDNTLEIFRKAGYNDSDLTQV